jgi:hypothetical protein
MLELVDKPIEDPGLLGKVIMLLLGVGRRARPIRRPENRHPQAIEYDRFLMVQPGVLAMFYLYPRHVKAVNIPRMP